MLAALDALSSLRSETRTVREVAAHFDRAAVEGMRAIEWKSSSLRRQTQRLLQESVAMMMGGYRNLLIGKGANV